MHAKQQLIRPLLLSYNRTNIGVLKRRGTMSKTAAQKAKPEVLDPDTIRKKILHILKIYPVISPTMLQGGLGPYMRPAQWRPVLKTLVEQGKVMETQESLQTHAGRYNMYSKLSLPGTEVTIGGG